MEITLRRGLAVAALAAACGACAGRAESPAPELLGPLTREEIEAAVPDWVAAEIESEPDAEVARRLAAAGPAEVDVYLGTWCSDSRRELARLWRALDDTGAEPAFRLRYFGVNRDKDEPRDLLVGLGLRYVPTLVVRRDGIEVGRIVEESPRGVEVDLLALLAGEATGVVSARTDLGPESGSAAPEG